MLRTTLKVLAGLALSAVLTALFSHVGAGHAAMGSGSESCSDRLALLSR